MLGSVEVDLDSFYNYDMEIVMEFPRDFQVI